MTVETSGHRIALITGCSTGIGRALAIKLSEQNYIVYAGARDTSTLTDIASQYLLPVKLDVTSAADISAVVLRITQEKGRLDDLVNNAGYGAMGPIIEMPPEKLQQQFDTNVFAPVVLTQRCFPLLRAGIGAQVINIGSVSGITPTPFSGAYCASKAALNALTDIMRMEFAPFGIHAMTVYPRWHIVRIWQQCQQGTE